jgi:hypothetical protein
MDRYSPRIEKAGSSGAIPHLKPSVLSDLDDEDAKRLIAEQASKFRELLAGDGRATRLTQLFDYLLERSTDLRPPKEIEIAMAVFGKTAEFDTSQDSTVRAHMYRLRQRLDSFNVGKSGFLLHIPKGEYRLILYSAHEAVEVSAPQPMLARTGQRLAWLAVASCFLATVALWALLFLGHSHARSVESSLSQSSFWQPIATHEQLPVIAAGDFYMVAESGPQGRVKRLTMRPAIHSERDLDDFLRMHPDEYSKLHDRDIHRVAASVATGAAAILPLIAAVRADHGTADIIPVSQISQETVDSRDVIYVEFFSQLGMLRSPVLHLSGFEPGADFDELRDVKSGTTFRAVPAPAKVSGGDMPKDPYGYDYGYIASFPGPSGHQAIVISGLEDAGLSQMIKLVSDKRQLDFLSRHTGGAKAFEALYRIRTSGGLIFDTSLLIARPMQVAKGGSASL